MIFQSLEFTKKRPFENVLIHGLIRDSQGRKMSKSLGNGVDPIKVVEDYGADALRYFITTNSTPGLDSRFSEEKIQAATAYLNKIWNAARYTISNLGENFVVQELDFKSLNSLDKWILSKFNETVKNVTSNMEKFELANASTHLYNFVYDDFCSWYLEMSKVTLQGENEVNKNNTRQVLYHILEGIIMMIYPYCPFITEEIYLNMPEHKDSIMLNSYPEYNDNLFDKKSMDEIEIIIKIIKDIRAFKVENDLQPNTPITLHFIDKSNIISNYETYLERFTFANKISFEENAESLKNYNIFIYGEIEMAIEQQINKEELIAKLDKEITSLKFEVERSEKLLSNPGFVAKAPEAKLNLEKEKLAKNKLQLESVLAKRNNL